MPSLGSSDLDVFPLCLGGNVFGWSADDAASYAVLDRYEEAGGNFIDTANSYMASAPGNSGGESETIIGRWFAERGNRDRHVIATKVGGRMPGEQGLTAEIVARASENSLRRLRTDRIDLYYAHFDDQDTPLEESFGAFDALVRAGKVRHVGVSNYSADRLRAVAEVCEREGFTKPVALQPHFNLVEREYETTLRPVAEQQGWACVPYYGLAKGFLAGKYRPGGAPVESVRAAGAGAYLSGARGPRVLEALDVVAGEHGVPVAAVALAWLRAQPSVPAPIASARTVAQLDPLFEQVTLTADELGRLSHRAA
jgi:aryl-alcohol dehydrogenase-like predicted oxidoreductase